MRRSSANGRLAYFKYSSFLLIYYQGCLLKHTIAFCDSLIFYFPLAYHRWAAYFFYFLIFIGAPCRLCAASPRAHSANATCLLWAIRCDPGRRLRDATTASAGISCFASYPHDLPNQFSPASLRLKILVAYFITQQKLNYQNLKPFITKPSVIRLASGWIFWLLFIKQRNMLMSSFAPGMAAETPQTRLCSPDARHMPKHLRDASRRAQSRGEELQRTARPGALIENRISI
jgi:hypothetical protein